MTIQMQASLDSFGFCNGPCVDESKLAAAASRMTSWSEFVSFVMRFSSPVRQILRDLPLTLVKGIEQRAMLSASQTIAYREEHMARIRRLVAMEGPTDQPRWRLLQRLGKIVGHPDSKLESDSKQPDGFRLLGALTPAPQWPDKQSQHTWSEEEHSQELQRLLAMHHQERAEGKFRIASNHAAELYDMLHKEAELGFWREMSLDEAQSKLGNFCCWLYFGVQESTKVRGCMAPEGANGPAVVFLPSKVGMAGLDGYISMCQTLAAAFRRRGLHPEVQGFAEDLEHGFRQFKLSSRDQPLLCSIARDTHGNIRVFVPSRLLFGPRGAPHVFCRVTDMLSAVAAVLLLIPNVAHVDDFVGADDAQSMSSARKCFVELCDLLNFRLKVCKARPSRQQEGGASSLIALGGLVEFESSFSHRQQGKVCSIDLPSAKAEKYSTQISAVLVQQDLSPTLAGKFVGQWDHASATATGKSGRAFTWPLRDLQRGSKVPWQVLQCALVGFLLLLSASGPMPVYVPGTLSRRRTLLFVDAATDGRGYRLAGVAWGPGWCHWFSVRILPGETRLLPWQASHLINEAEALAALVALLALGPLLQDTDIMLWIDSQAAEGVLVKAYSKSPYLTIIAALFWRAVRGFRCSAWIGRVPSALNVADGPSRNDSSYMCQLGATRLPAAVPEEGPWTFFLDFLQGRHAATSDQNRHAAKTTALRHAAKVTQQSNPNMLEANLRKARRKHLHQGQG
jgi:hypothetical protein